MRCRQHALPLALPQPRDRRLRRIAAALARSPDDLRSVEAWAATSGLSSRSLARRWQAETGMTLSQWRQRLRVLLSLPRLLAGEPVISVALSMGYDTPAPSSPCSSARWGDAARGTEKGTED
jgi:AraC-like DNA-binding protein